MPAYKPQDCDLLLYELVDKGDFEAALDLYEPDAVFVVSQSETVTGRDAIGQVLRKMSAMGATGKIEAVTSVLSADGSVAFTRTKGTSTRPGPDGTAITSHFHSVEVVRRQPDGTWRILIDDPGGEGLG